MRDIQENLVSVVVPVFNGERYLTEALKSLIAQTYANLEIIVVDDGSSDSIGVVKIIESLSDSRIRLIQKENGGVSTALNAAIDSANGKYFTWLSHDDIFHVEKIQKQVDALELAQNPKCVHYTAYKTIDSQGHLIHIASLKDELNKSFTHLGPIERGVLYGCAVMFNLNFMKSVGYFDENLKYVQDYNYWLKLIDAGANFELLDEPLVGIRIHSEQTGKKEDTYNENFELWAEIATRWVSFCEATYEDHLNLAYLRDFRIFAIQNKVEGAISVLDDFESRILNRHILTVIVPIRGRIHLLKRCIQSILDQDLQSIEVILVDDNTNSEISNTTLQILKSFNHCALAFQKNSHKHGPAGARNQGLDLAKFGFVTFLDSDDYFLPGKLRHQLSEMLINRVDFSHTNYIRHYEIENEFKLIDTSHHSGDSQLRYILERGCGISTSTVMVRYSSPFSEIRFDEDKRFGEDIFYFLDFANKSDRPFLHLKAYGTVMRHHIESASSNAHAQESHRNDIEALFRKEDPKRLHYTDGISIRAHKINGSRLRFCFTVHGLYKKTRRLRLALLKIGSRILQKFPQNSTLKKSLVWFRAFLLK